MVENDEEGILVQVYMTRKEKEEIEKYAEEEHRSLSQYLKLKGLKKI